MNCEMVSIWHFYPVINSKLLSMLFPSKLLKNSVIANNVTEVFGAAITPRKLEDTPNGCSARLY